MAQAKPQLRRHVIKSVSVLVNDAYIREFAFATRRILNLAPFRGPDPLTATLSLKLHTQKLLSTHVQVGSSQGKERGIQRTH